MKKSFISSLCHKGILGGALYLDENSLTFKTNKLTVDREYRNLILPLNEICAIDWKWIIFPIANVKMKSGKQYRLIIFNKGRFEKHFNKAKDKNT